MTRKRSWTAWMRWLRRAPARPHRKSDFGDHGTAFGLDLCLEQQRLTGREPTMPAEKSAAAPIAR